MAGAATRCGPGLTTWSGSLEKAAGTRRHPTVASLLPPPCPIASGRCLRVKQPEGFPIRTEATLERSRRATPNVRCSAAVLADAPLANSAEDGSGFCGEEGTVLQRPPVQQGSADKTYLVHTFGCQMNSADSERMAGVLEGMGYSSTDDLDTANVIVYNTCSIRDKAEQKVGVQAFLDFRYSISDFANWNLSHKVMMLCFWGWCSLPPQTLGCRMLKAGTPRWCSLAHSSKALANLATLQYQNVGEAPLSLP